MAQFSQPLVASSLRIPRDIYRIPLVFFFSPSSLFLAWLSWLKLPIINQLNMKSVFALSLLSLAAATPVSPRGTEGKSCPAPDPVKKCQKSLSGLQWTVHGFDYHASYTFTTPAHQNSWGYVNFNISNSIVPYTASCSASSSQLSDFFYGTQEYTCTLVGSGAPTGAAVKFKYSRPSGQLDITESVVCQGKPEDK